MNAVAETSHGDGSSLEEMHRNGADLILALAQMVQEMDERFVDRREEEQQG